MTGAEPACAETAWDAILARLRSGEITTREAEAEAVNEGYPPPIGDPDPAGFPRHRWRLATALLWIAWRDAGRVAAELPRLAFWGERVRYEVDEGQLMPLDVAERELGDALGALPGLTATGVLPGVGRSSAIPPEAWPGLMFGPIGEDKAVSAGWAEPRFEGVRVSADAMMREWPVPSTVETASAVEAPAPAPARTSEVRARRVRQPTKPQVVADALLERFPIRPNGLSGLQICREIESMVRFTIQPSTLKRSLALAAEIWGQTGSD